jgi:DNA-binding winged helix-turn-helix (wHTH) protein/TolB-like protein
MRQPGQRCATLTCDNVGVRLRFGLFEFDSATRELRREGMLVRLQPQPAEVLALLIDRAGEVVLRGALRDAVWGGDTFVDFDRGLNFCIAQIRAALGDSVDSPRFVRTIPKRGYQFIAPVERVDRDSEHQQSEDAAAVRRITTRRVAMALLVVAVTAVGVAGGRWWISATLARPLVLGVLRFDNDTGNPTLDRFADVLTDTVVAQLTAIGQNRFQVIGNAAILRRPRADRDLRAIASSLGVGYVVLGQVQPSGDQVRVLAHLIRAPEGTHVWVTRLERPVDAQLDIAETIAREVAQHLTSDSTMRRTVLIDRPKPLTDPKLAVHLFLASR